MQQQPTTSRSPRVTSFLPAVNNNSVVRRNTTTSGSNNNNQNNMISSQNQNNSVPARARARKSISNKSSQFQKNSQQNYNNINNENDNTHKISSNENTHNNNAGLMISTGTFSNLNASARGLPSTGVPFKKLNSSAMAAFSAKAKEHHKVCVFDVNSGDIEITNNRDSDRTRLISKLHREMQNDEKKKKQMEQRVNQEPFNRQKEFAMETLGRFHANKEKAMFTRRTLPENVSAHRANILKHLEIDRCFGDLSKETGELAAVRIKSAAVDAMMYREAQTTAEQQLKQQRSLILPENARPVDVLELRLDAWRRQNVPFAPRCMVS